MFYFATSLVVSCLATGSLGERSKLEPILGFVGIQQILVYPFFMCWAWNLEGGWLKALGFFDRGGSVIIFNTGALAGIIGAIVLGPRYNRYPRKKEKAKLKSATSNRLPLPAQLEDKLSETLEVDEMFLRKVRNLIHKET